MEESKIVENRVYELQADMMLAGKEYKAGERKMWGEWKEIMQSASVLEMHCSYLNFKRVK